MNDGSIEIRDLIYLLPTVAAIIGMYFALRNGKRTDRQDAATEAKMDARIETKLDSVQRGVESIQLDFKAQQRQLNDISDRLTRTEEMTKSAHRRIDELKDTKGG